MTFHALLLLLTTLSLLLGSGFVLIGVIGLLKFNDPMTRLHAPTKVSTIGIGMLLVASMLNALAAGNPSFHEFLILTFLFVSAPISAHFLAKVTLHKRTCETPPKPSQDDAWSTLNSPDDELNGAG